MFVPNKSFSLIANAVVCLLLLAMGCAYITEEAAKSKAESKEKISTGAVSLGTKTAEPEAKFEKLEAKIPTETAVTLALKFIPQDCTTYRLINEAEKSVSWEGPLPEKPIRYYRVRCWPGCHSGSDYGKYPDKPLNMEPIHQTSALRGHKGKNRPQR